METTSIISISSSPRSSPLRPLSLRKLPEVKTPIEKVEQWMGLSHVGLLPEPYEENEKVEMVCIRYDFDKNNCTAATPPPNSCFTSATPLFKYMEHGSPPKMLSPETQKKELCTYLQLMKPGERKARVDSHNGRRTTRNQRSQKEEAKAKLKEAELQEYDLGSNASPLISLDDLKSTNGNYLNGHKEQTKVKVNKYLPLPPERFYTTSTDFEDALSEILKESKRKPPDKIRPQKPKFNFEVKRGPGRPPKQHRCRWRPLKKLRSRGLLRDVPLDRLIFRKRPNIYRKPKEKIPEKKQEKIICEAEKVVIIKPLPDENIDLKNFVDDMLELDKMSEEHRKSVIESRIIASNCIANLISSSTSEDAVTQKAYKIFADVAKETAEKETSIVRVIQLEHDYANVETPASEHVDDSDSSDSSSDDETMDAVPLTTEVVPEPDDAPVTMDAVPLATDMVAHAPPTHVKRKSLHRSLVAPHRKKFWCQPPLEEHKLNHSITIAADGGDVVKAFYLNYHLVVAQERCISFWMQSALGSVLGAQNMWIPKGEAARLPVHKTYAQKASAHMVATTETSLAYIELWTKEHKSDVREVPVADVFATVYFWRVRQSGIDRKALQLENIKGFAGDVQYVVTGASPIIVVSWFMVRGTEKMTRIRSYQLAADFQTVANITEIQGVQHYIASLHTIEDCDNLVMGWGDAKVTLWNVDYGYVVATVELQTSPVAMHWVKCDRGFLFAVQEDSANELQLVAINGLNQSWKKLQTFAPPPGFDGLKGATVENGVLVAFYSQGLVCWNAQTGDLVEEVADCCVWFPSGKHIIMLADEQIFVRHTFSHLITADDA